MIKRLFDIFFSAFGLLILFPFFLLIALLIKINSRGPAFYKQERIGKGGKPFKMIKFRTMQIDSDSKGLLTIGGKDSRVTTIGYYLRKFKIDELPQLVNVLMGDMSFVGPRPEVKKYVDLYTTEQREVLSVKPGITDYASIEYRDESAMLAGSENPEEFYTTVVMPAKLKINLEYINDRNILTDVKIIFKTVLTIFK